MFKLMYIISGTFTGILAVIAKHLWGLSLETTLIVGVVLSINSAIGYTAGLLDRKV